MTSITKNKFPLFSGRWHNQGGYGQVLRIAVPLILGSTGMAIQQFVDRMFLAWYSPEAVAATMPAMIIHFTIMNLFVGTAGYVGTFVAQYFGANQYKRIGPIVWQGIYVAIIACIALLLFIPLAGPFFRLVGHTPEVQKLEIIYFQITCLASGPSAVIAVLSGFFTGRGRTKPVMTITLIGNFINVLLNYLLIFGHWGFPEMGVKGAAIATVIATFITFLVFLFISFNSNNEKRYCILSGWKPDFLLFSRLLRFGLPNGFQFFIVYTGVSVFILLVGRLGTIELAATNIAFNINMLAFMPMYGFSMAVMILVGQNQGRMRPDLSEYSVYSGLHLTSIYMVSIAAAYVLFPDFFLWPFSIKADPVTFVPIKELTTILLRFIALYSLFDTLSLVFSSGIKGAGDTKFVMQMFSIFSIFLLAVPTYLVLNIFNLGLYAAWSIITVYIIIIGITFLLRFLGGKWKSMRVIEVSQIVTADSALPE